MVKGIIKTVGDSNEDLTIGLEKICGSKKVPRRWMNLNKPKFVVSNMITKIKKNILFMSMVLNFQSFLKYLRFKIPPGSTAADQLWGLFSKAIEVEKKKEIKRNTKPSKTGNKDETIDENEITALIEEKMEN